MSSFKLCYITDRKSLMSGTVGDRIAEAIRAGVDLVQIREKDLAAKELAALAEAGLHGAQGTATRLVVNDRLDVALAVGAAGVHLGTKSLPAHVVRRIAPQGFLIGVSCHSLKEARGAEAAGADYVLLGPIFETPSKLAYGPPLGLEVLRAVTSRLKIPVLAVGGITLENARPCFEAGAAGIAAIRLFQECSSLFERIAELRKGCPVGP